MALLPQPTCTMAWTGPMIVAGDDALTERPPPSSREGPRLLPDDDTVAAATGRGTVVLENLTHTGSSGRARLSAAREMNGLQVTRRLPFPHPPPQVIQLRSVQVTSIGPRACATPW